MYLNYILLKKNPRLFLGTLVILALFLVSVPQMTQPLVFADSSTVPNASTDLTATSMDGQTGIILSWTAPASDNGSAMTGYMIERSADGGSTWSTIVPNTGSTSTMYEDACLPGNTTYTYRVSAINSVGTGSPSDTASAITSGPFSPPPPIGLTATTVSSIPINLSWTAPACDGGSPITGYEVDRSTDGGLTWSTIVSNTGLTTTTYSDTGLSPGTTYTYRVSAINSVWSGLSSPIISVTTLGLG